MLVKTIDSVYPYEDRKHACGQDDEVPNVKACGAHSGIVLEGFMRTEFHESPARYEFYDKHIDSDTFVPSTRTVLTYCT